jgi:hypothetical protein
MELLGDVGQMEDHFSVFRDDVNLNTDRCTVCAKHAIGSKIILGAPD